MGDRNDRDRGDRGDRGDRDRDRRKPVDNPTRRKYKLLPTPKPADPKDNEIRIRSEGKPFPVSVRIAHLLLDEKKETVELSATGRAITRAL